jgi:hypothetical protein
VDDKRGFPQTLLRRLYETVVKALPLDSAGKAARRLQKRRASENIFTRQGYARRISLSRRRAHRRGLFGRIRGLPALKAAAWQSGRT